MKKKLKAILPVLLTTTMVLSQFTFVSAASAFSTIDNFVVDSQKIVDGLTYNHIVKLTTLGNIDIHTLYYDADYPNVDLEIFRSSELGKRDTLTNMAEEENILAGVNASFFDTSRNHSDILGFEKDNDEIFYARNKYNETPQASSLMINEDTGMFDIGYIVPTLNLATGEGRSISITGYNTVSSFFNPAVIKGNKLTDTSYIDENYSVYKVITDDQGVIKQVVEPKTVVNVADDEYLITLPQASYDALGGSLDVGDQFTFSISANFDIDQYNTIVSGGGTLVKDGQVDMSGIQVSANSRQPRTAIGVTQDGDIIEMVIDGRGDSIGATLEETANYMIQMGAYNAICLDGGGSTELVKKDETGTIRVENEPSDGSERKVTNGVGFKAALKTGVATQCEYLNDNRTFVGNPLDIKVVGKDEYYNNVNLDTTKLSYEVSDIEGSFNGNIFTPTTSGIGNITTYYDGVALSSQEIIVEPQPTEVFFEDNTEVVEPNGTLKLSVYTLDEDGYKYKVDDNITWSVDNNAMGSVSGGTLTAGSDSGKITVTAETPYGSVSEQVLVGSQKTNVPITGFENGETVSTGLEPNGAEGKAVISTDWTPQGKYAVKIRYGFSPDIEEKQVVSANFSGITIDEADRIKFDMTTPAMDNAVTLTIVDSSGTEYRIVMADSFDTDGKRTLVADLPSDISYPATVKSVNVEYQPSAEKTEEEVGAIYFDNLMTEVDTKVENTQPIYPKTDSLATDTVSNSRLSIIGKVSYPTGSESLATSSLSQKAANSAKTYVAKTSTGLGDINNVTVGNDVYTKSQEADFDANVYTLESNANTILKSDSKQWKSLLNDIKATGKKNIIIIANKSPLSTGYDSTESYVMTSRLTELAEDYGKNIYFINGSSHEEVPVVTYKDSVHYIDLPELSLSAKAEAPWSVDFYLENGDLKYNFSK